MRLWAIYEGMEDPRNASGRRYGFGSILKLITAGLMCGRKSLAQIVLWGRSLSPKALNSLGFKGRVPCVATLSNLLRRIDVNHVESTLALYALGAHPLLEVGTPVALDGKTLRATHQEGVPLVHLLSVFVSNTKAVMGQIKMNPGENEITAAIRLLETLTLKGLIITGDAIFAQKKSAN